MKHVFLFLLAIFTAGTVCSQTIIRGTVTDKEREPLPGVTVMVKGTTTGTITDENGNYSLNVNDITSGSTIIAFSFMGFRTEDVVYNGNSNISVELEDDSQIIEEVVVTALGIRREERGLGYATQKVDGGFLTSTMPTNWSSALEGKVAGLSVANATGPLGSSHIKLRGDVSLNFGGNNALIIMDGVPLSDTNHNPGVANPGGTTQNSMDYGNGFSDLNPEDIESVQVLKGASATALYGSRAANGVIMITTKSGASRQKKGIGVSVSSNASFDNFLRLPEYQYEFGQGLPANVGVAGSEYERRHYYSYGAGLGVGNSAGSSSCWGPRFDPSVLFYQYDPEVQGRGANPTPWVGYPDNFKKLYQTGYTLTNTLAVEGKTDQGSFRTSVSHTKNEWILPNTGFQRITVSASAQQQLSRRLTADVRATYINRKVDNTPAQGYQYNSIPMFNIYTMPNFQMEWWRPMWNKGEEGVRQLQPFSVNLPNPYVLLYETTNSSQKHSFISTVSTTLQINQFLDFMVRSGIQATTDLQEQRSPLSDLIYPTGFYRKRLLFDYEINSDALLSFHHSFASGLHANATAGGNMMRMHHDSFSSYVIGLMTPGVYKLANGSSTPISTNGASDRARNSLFFAANFAYNNFLFVDVTGRNDWSSTLPKANRSFFYPSVSVSVLMNEITQLPSNIDLLKIRASWAQVGNDTNPYRTAEYFSNSAFAGSASASSTMYNPSFKPEISTNYEAGFDFRMFRHRVGVDFTFYHNITKNQIIDAPVDPSTGYSRAIINSGKVRNIGYEVLLNGAPVVTRDFKWTATFNWSRNENKILSLAEGSDENQVIYSIYGAIINGTVGGTTGDIWGYKYLRNPNGEIINENGIPARPGEIEYVGSIHPDWKAGLYNEFTYKNFRLGVQIDGVKGGIIYSQTWYKMAEQGKAKTTLNGRMPGTKLYMDGADPRLAAAGLYPISSMYTVAPGVEDNGDGTYSPNTQIVTVSNYYLESVRSANAEANTHDGSFIKLRELRFDYSLPKKMLDKTPFTNLKVGLYGRNLALWTKYPVYDPEAAMLDGGYIKTGIEVGTLPTTRTLGINLNLEF